MHFNLEAKFAAIGARVSLNGPLVEPRRFRLGETQALSLDVLSDRRGEFFDVRIRRPDLEILVPDVQPKDRHLLLLVREPSLSAGRTTFMKSKYLCGHDERHWFVAAIPERAPVGTVLQAKEALKPERVRTALDQAGINEKRGRNRRKNEVFKRQGEWFFLPAPALIVPPEKIRRKEPITRGTGSKPHVAEFCYRTRGTIVYVNDQHPLGIEEYEYHRLLREDPEQRFAAWSQRMRDASVYVRGTIRHADHQTILLEGWHEVLMNTENQAAAMKFVAFLD